MHAVLPSKTGAAIAACVRDTLTRSQEQYVLFMESNSAALGATEVNLESDIGQSCTLGTRIGPRWNFMCPPKNTGELSGYPWAQLQDMLSPDWEFCVAKQTLYMRQVASKADTSNDANEQLRHSQGLQEEVRIDDATEGHGAGLREKERPLGVA